MGLCKTALDLTKLCMIQLEVFCLLTRVILQASVAQQVVPQCVYSKLGQLLKWVHNVSFALGHLWKVQA